MTHPDQATIERVTQLKRQNLVLYQDALSPLIAFSLHCLGKSSVLAHESIELVRHGAGESAVLRTELGTLHATFKTHRSEVNKTYFYFFDIAAIPEYKVRNLELLFQALADVTSQLTPLFAPAERDTLWAAIDKMRMSASPRLRRYLTSIIDAINAAKCEHDCPH